MLRCFDSDYLGFKDIPYDEIIGIVYSHEEETIVVSSRRGIFVSTRENIRNLPYSVKFRCCDLNFLIEEYIIGNFIFPHFCLVSPTKMVLFPCTQKRKILRISMEKTTENFILKGKNIKKKILLSEIKSRNDFNNFVKNFIFQITKEYHHLLRRAEIESSASRGNEYLHFIHKNILMK